MELHLDFRFFVVSPFFTPRIFPKLIKMLGYGFERFCYFHPRKIGQIDFHVDEHIFSWVVVATKIALHLVSELHVHDSDMFFPAK